MAVYEQNKRKALEEAAREQAAFAQAKKSYAQQLIERMNAKVDQAAGEAVAEKQAQLEQADGRYRGKFDANAVQQLAQERQIAERLANLGLTGSGAQAAQETAAAEQRQRGDAAIRQEKAAYVTGLTDSIRQEQETAQEKKEQYRAEVMQDLQETLTSNERKLREAAIAKADKAYAQELAKEQAQAKAAEKKQVSQARVKQYTTLMSARLKVLSSQQGADGKPLLSGSEARKRMVQELLTQRLTTEEVMAVLDALGISRAEQKSLLQG